MEAILVLLAVVLFIGFLASPIIALVIASGAKRKAEELQQIVSSQIDELARLRSEFAAFSARPAHSFGSPIEVATAAAMSAGAAAEIIVPLAEAPPATVAASSPDIDDTAAALPAAYLQQPGMPATGEEAAETAAAVTETPMLEQHGDLAEAEMPQQAPAKPVDTTSSFASTLFARARAWLFGGNLVAKIGLLILFIGVSFLLKYAAARVTIPIEFRLAGVVLVDILFLTWGWRIREKRPGIALPVQGAAMAILMLVTFGAFKMYHLVPATLAFGLLFVLTAFTCLLAVMQNALWLAIFGIAGGFAAPILTSTGQGSHVALFSYYALLNAGILAIALKRSWRSLNLLGFVFTFLIGTTWGVLKYSPEDYFSAQGFLSLFFLFYVAIAIVYASRQAPQLKNYVDGTLVFGTPLLAFGLQYGLVRHMQFGLAFSALALGLFYMSLTLVLWQKRGSSLKLLVESFFALAIVFGTLAIPFALDGRWTSAAWALEGAGIVWVGLRQRQPLAWMFGLLVQAGAWLSFLGSVTGLDPVAAMQSNLWLGFLLLAGTALLMAINFRAQPNQTVEEESEPRKEPDFTWFATAFLALASIWFVAGAWVEICLRTSGAKQATLLVASALVAAIGLGFIARRMQWQAARYFALVVQMIAGVTLFGLAVLVLDWPFHGVSTNLLDGPFLGSLMIGAGAFFSAWVFYRQDQSGQTSFQNAGKALLLWSGLWWYGMILYSLTAWIGTHYLIYRQVEGQPAVSALIASYALGLALTGPLFALLARRAEWSDLRLSAIPNWALLAIATVMLMQPLYGARRIPVVEIWVAYLSLWLSAEWLMTYWQKHGWPLRENALRFLHTVRTVGPWLMIWPLGYHWLASWLHGGTQQEQELLAASGWFTSGSWPRYLPVWVMMAVLAWTMQRARLNSWPVKPISAWYQRVLIPLGAAWSIALVVIWNLTQNGSMAPLPYLPLLNPLDLSTCFAILLGMATYRLANAQVGDVETAGPALLRKETLAKLWLPAFIAAYCWFNLVLLRTVSHYMDIPYQFDLLFASQFVQAMLSLVWSVTALILMRRAVKLVTPRLWMLGAALLGLVVLKLFFVDLSNAGGVERIVSFVGVGLLMVAIGYLAPYPNQGPAKSAAQDEPETAGNADAVTQ
ncbi:DUF2339 domain-containing protein [soil metagenome]